MSSEQIFSSLLGIRPNHAQLSTVNLQSITTCLQSHHCPRGIFIHPPLTVPTAQLPTTRHPHSKTSPTASANTRKYTMLRNQNAYVI